MAALDFSTYLTAISGVTQVIGSLVQGSAAESQARYNARVSRYNAQVQAVNAEAEAQQLDYNETVALEDAEMARLAAAFQERQYRLQAGRVEGQNRAAIGASGVLMRGSPLQVLVDNAYQAETQAQLIRYRGELEALAQERRAALFGYQADIRRHAGGQAIIAGDQQAGILETKGRDAFGNALLQSAGILASTGGKIVGAKA